MLIIPEKNRKILVEEKVSTISESSDIVSIVFDYNQLKTLQEFRSKERKSQLTTLTYEKFGEFVQTLSYSNLHFIAIKNVATIRAADIQPWDLFI